MRCLVNYTLSNLVIYSLKYIPASRAFPKAKYYVVCTEFPMSSKFYFQNGKLIFPYSFSVKNIWNIPSIKFKM